MSIFLITPKKEEEPPPSSSPETLPSEGAKEPEAKESSQVVPEVGLVPQKEIDEKTIVLDGPLSQVYTQALNQAYAKESNITEISTLVEAKQSQEEKQELNDEMSYLYVVDSDDLEEDGYVNAFEAIRIASEQFKHLYLCLEHGKNITRRSESFTRFAMENQITVLPSRKKAIEMIHNTIRNQKG